MTNKETNRLTITTEQTDGGWIIRCPELGLLATDEVEHMAFAKMGLLINHLMTFAAAHGRLESVFKR